MADTKISALAAATVADDANELAINEAGTSKKLTVALLRGRMPGGIASITAAAAIANTETVVVSATLPAGFMAAGTTLRIRAFGVYTSGATGGTPTCNIRIGPTTLTGNIPVTCGSANGNSQTAQPVSFEALVTVRTNGAGGTVIGGAEYKRFPSAPSFSFGTSTSTVAVDTTVANLIEFTFISGNAGTTTTWFVAEIEVVKM